jgi:putative flippase GtrA
MHRKASAITILYRRFAVLIAELAKFGVVGGLAAIIDLGGAAALHGAEGVGPLTSKVISTTLAAAFAYAGNRLWTFRHRASQGVVREWLLFFMLNAIGLLIALLVIGLTEYTLGLHGLIAYNAAQVAGTALGTIFRYWSYKRWVFLAAKPAAEPADTLAPLADAPLADARLVMTSAEIAEPDFANAGAGSRR